MTNAEEKIYLESLGCAKNLVDSEIMIGFLSRFGYSFTVRKEEADIIIINTCAFIEDATKESIETILWAVREKRSGVCTYLIVCGCLPQRYKEELLGEFPEVDLFLGTGEFQNIAKHVKNLINGKTNAKLHVKRPSFLLDADTPRILSTLGSSTYVKIAEGCSHYCTYCTIPNIRGPYKARSAHSIVQEAKRLAGNGIKEINLISQDTTQYRDFAGLLKKLVKISGIKWIRLLYCHPRNLSNEIINVLIQEEKICNYLDIPLQHITDPILRRMGRQITRKKIESLIETIRNAFPQIAIRTTFIVGFPGETDKDFEDLLQFVADTRFDHLGAFQYRDEDGTPALKLPSKVPENIKKERYHRLLRLQANISKAKNRALVGKEVMVLVDNIPSSKKYRLQARTEFQAPEVDGVVYLNEDVPIGSFIHARIIKALTYDLVAKCILI